DQPALAALWFEGARGGLVGALSQYLRDAINRGEIAGSPDVAVAARLIVETIVYWAVHRKWDPRPQLVDDDSARETVIGLLINACSRSASLRSQSTECHLEFRFLRRLPRARSACGTRRVGPRKSRYSHAQTLSAEEWPGFVRPSTKMGANYAIATIRRRPSAA